MKRLVLAAVIVLALAAPAMAQVHVDIGIRLPGPPALAVIPGAPVYYAPRAPANIFFYGHQYWLFHGNSWYAGPSWNGPWAFVDPGYIPGPILRVPVRYYHVPPPAWRGWHRDAHPRWDGHWGRSWHEAAHERSWREREEHWKHQAHHGDRHDRGKHGRGHNGKHDRDRDRHGRGHDGR